MRIRHVSADVVDIGERNAHYVRIETDTGIVGIGETVLRRRDATVHANLLEVAEHLIGRDPLTIEDHAEKLFRDSFWAGGPLHAAARSAIDIALWDIKGQYLNAPVFELLGGRTRPTISVYAHASAGGSPEAFSRNLLAVQARGYLGAKAGLPLFYGGEEVDGGSYSGYPAAIDPSLRETEYLATATIDRIVDWFDAARRAVGWGFELMLDCHGRLNLQNATRLVDALRPFKLLFIEEPMPPEAVDDYARLRRRSVVPIAAGERLVSIFDVRPFLEKGAVSVLQCDVVNCGGLTGAKKIAAMAEAYYVPMAPHNPNGPIATLAAAHLMASIPNAYILETNGSETDDETFAKVVDRPPRVIQGTLTLDDRAPGLGAALLESAPISRPPGTYGGTR
jgi:galactonate dehydratase